MRTQKVLKCIDSCGGSDKYINGISIKFKDINGSIYYVEYPNTSADKIWFEEGKSYSIAFTYQIEKPSALEIELNAKPYIKMTCLRVDREVC